MDQSTPVADHYDLPDAEGQFGPYGGSFVSETPPSAREQPKAEYARSSHRAKRPDARYRLERETNRLPFRCLRRRRSRYRAAVPQTGGRTHGSASRILANPRPSSRGAP